MTDDDKDTKDETEEKEELTVEGLQAKLAASEEKGAQLLTRLDRLEGLLIRQGVQQGGDEEVVEEETLPKPKGEEEVDVENMSAKDMIRYVLGTIDKRLDAHSKAVDAKITRVATEAKAKELVDEMVEVMNEYGKDNVLALQSQIVRKMADNPKLSVEEAYFLAAKAAGKDVGGKKPADKPNAEEPETRESLLRDDGLPPRGSAKPNKREADPTTFAEAGSRAWKKLGL